MYKTYEYLCKKCGVRATLLVGADDKECQQECSSCGGSMFRTWSLPHIRTAKTSSSFVDGQRKGTKEYQTLLKQTRLEDQLHDSEDFQEKAEITKELDSLVPKKP